MNVRYLTQEPLGHLRHDKKSSFIWKLMYKRVLSKMNKELINPQSIKKILFNMHRLNSITLKGAVYNNVSLRNEAIWYMDDNIEYYYPLCISFSDGLKKIDVVLIDGEIDLRTSSMRTHKDKLHDHTPLLVVKVLKDLEDSFEALQNYIESYKKV